ncbi:hypothetical protein D9756_002320 [Leucocoprinus leucothites]|uniref:CID domain-containing protein n=1 Tax=Leucocoprinus leucothites TaxID=201217 RepID=A0A8H5GCA1_9AGAR|nr:hypothetical protein D9756_002320 [Leucoagaricus leucothites]
MSAIQDFETALNEVVQAKRLSQSKMTKLTEVAMGLMEHDTQLVSMMYRTHKSLPSSCKISSLYVFDALSRAARQQIIKHNLSERSGSGNCATFLSKIAGVLEGLFQDMIATGLPEAKVSFPEIYSQALYGSVVDTKHVRSSFVLSYLVPRWLLVPLLYLSPILSLDHALQMTFSSPISPEKTKKIHDIWVKGATFPPDILSRLSDIVFGKDKGAYHSFLYAEYLFVYITIISHIFEFESASVPIDTSSTPRASSIMSTQSTQKPAATSVDSQATLLALLTQAANQQIAQTTTNTVASPTSSAANSTHLLLQYLQSASANSTAANQLSSTTSPVSDTPIVSQASTDPRIPKPSVIPHGEPARGRQSPRHDSYRSPPRDERYHDRGYDDRAYSRSDPKGNPRRRGRWNRWDEREPDYQRGPNKDSWYSRRGHSRSRSPEDWVRRGKSPTFSPPRRRPLSPRIRDRGNNDSPTTSENTAKDEFGRDIRSPSPSKSPASNSTTIHSTTTSPITPSTPHDPKAEFSSTSTSNDSISSSSSIAANTFSKDPNTSNMSVESSNKPALSQSGLESFNMSTFDPTSPASWEALGKMWEAMNGYTPSTEELMQFMMMGAMNNPIQSKDWQQQDKAGPVGRNEYGGDDRGAARGRGGYEGYYGNSRNNHHEWSTGSGQSTDAVVLGGGEMDDEGSTDRADMEQQQSPNVGGHSGGRMQKVGDKWVFVRNDSAI